MKSNSGFSLVEVTLALGISSFALLAVVGLLPVGLAQMRDSREETSAALTVEMVARALRNASYDAGSKSYEVHGNPEFSGMGWNLGQKKEFNLAELSDVGTSTEKTLEQRLALHVEIDAPSEPSQTTRALISVAWPSSAQWSAGKWTKSQGSLTTAVILLPNY